MQDVARTVGNETGGDVIAQGFGITARGVVCGAEVATAVRHADARGEVNAFAVQGGVCGQWHLAGAFEVGVDDALGMHAEGGVGVVQRGEQRVNGARFMAFDANRALADSG